MPPSDLAALPQELCRVFLGWRLREDYEALLALGEGSLRVDLRTGEAWCDDEPLPPLFIAAELRALLDAALAAQGVPPGTLQEARLDAVFRGQQVRRAGRDVPILRLSCRATLATAAGRWSAEANNAAAAS